MREKKTAESASGQYQYVLKTGAFVYGIMKLTQMVPKIDAAKSELSLL